MVTLIYKASAGIKVSLEMKTADGNYCTNSDVQEVTGEFAELQKFMHTS